MSRMGNALGKFAVVGKKKKSLAVCVETPHGKQPAKVVRHERQNRGPVMRVPHCTKDTRRFVKGEIYVSLSPDAFAMHTNNAGGGIYRYTLTGYRLSVHRNEALLDQIFTGAA